MLQRESQLASRLSWFVAVFLVLFALFALGLVVLRLPAGGLLAGLVAAQIAGTLGLIRYG